MKQKTIFRDPESKWKPINRQAVRIAFPAKGMNLPPSEPLFEPTLEERLKQESDLRKRKIAELEREAAIRQERGKQKAQAHHDKCFKRKMERYKSKQARVLAKAVEKARKAAR